MIGGMTGTGFDIAFACQTAPLTLRKAPLILDIKSGSGFYGGIAMPLSLVLPGDSFFEPVQASYNKDPDMQPSG